MIRGSRHCQFKRVTPALATTGGLSLRQATDLKLSCIHILPLDPDPWEIASQFVTFHIRNIKINSYRLCFVYVCVEGHFGGLIVEYIP
jgi:hypothetical protein